MVSVAGIGHRVRGFKHGRSDEFLKTIKICSTPSFGREVKSKVRCRKILRRVKITCKYELKYFRQFLLLSTRWQLVLPERIGEGIRSFPCRYHSTMVPHAHISLWWWTIDTIVAAVQRCRLTPLTCSLLSSYDDRMTTLLPTPFQNLERISFTGPCCVSFAFRRYSFRYQIFWRMILLILPRHLTVYHLRINH
jgi:hypothetical protein